MFLIKVVLAFLKTGLISRCFDNSWGRVLDKAAVPDLLTYDQLLPAVPPGLRRVATSRAR